jgi:hypothetical protein
LTTRKASLEAQKRLGKLLILRREELDPRYQNRRTFAAERKINYKLSYDLEAARRGNFALLVLRDKVAGPYGVTFESIQNVLDEVPGADLEAVPGTPPHRPPRQHRVSRPLPAAAGPLQQRMLAHVEEVWTEVTTAAYQGNADQLTGVQVFGVGTNDAYTWDLYHDLLDLQWRVRTIALTRAVADLSAT